MKNNSCGKLYTIYRRIETQIKNNNIEIPQQSLIFAFGAHYDKYIPLFKILIEYAYKEASGSPEDELLWYDELKSFLNAPLYLKYKGIYPFTAERMYKLEALSNFVSQREDVLEFPEIDDNDLKKIDDKINSIRSEYKNNDFDLDKNYNGQYIKYVYDELIASIVDFKELYKWFGSILFVYYKNQAYTMYYDTRIADLIIDWLEFICGFVPGISQLLQMSDLLLLAKRTISPPIEDKTHENKIS